MLKSVCCPALLYIRCVVTLYSTIMCSRTVYPKKYANGFCFAVLCCGYTLTDLPISIRLTSLALWQSNDCPSASKAILMTMDKYFMWIHYERLHNHNKAKHTKTVCIFLGIYCIPLQTVGSNLMAISTHTGNHQHASNRSTFSPLICQHTTLYQLGNMSMLYPIIRFDASYLMLGIGCALNIKNVGIMFMYVFLTQVALMLCII